MFGGPQQVLYLLTNSGCGYENILLCPQGSEVEKAAKEQGIKTVSVPMAGDIDATLIYRLCSVIKQLNIQLLVVHSRRGADYYAGIAARLMNIKAILVRRVDNTESRLVSRFKYAMYEKTICISDAIRSVLISQGVPETKLTVIKDSVDTQTFQPASRLPGVLNKRFGIPKDSIVVGVIAQLIARKGHRHLIDIMPRILTTVPEAHFVFFGKGKEEVALKKIVNEANLSKYVTFAGFCSDMPDIIPQLDLVAHPALKEGMGVALLQASSCGVPIVAYSAGGIPEAVEHMQTGYLANVGDLQGLKSGICKLLLSNQHRKALGHQGRNKALSDFDVTNMVEQYKKVYQEITSEFCDCAHYEKKINEV